MRFKKICIAILTISFIGVYSYSEKSKRNPHYSIIFHKRARECEGQCGIKKQRRYYEKALYHDPGFGDAYYRLGLLSEGEGNFSKALMLYKKAATFDHTHHEANYDVGFQYFQDGDFERALRYLLVSEQSEPGYDNWHNKNELHPSTWLNNYYIARIYEKRKNYQLAREHYERSMVKGGSMIFKAWLGLGVIYHLMGDYPNAEVQRDKLWYAQEEPEMVKQLQRYMDTGQYPEILSDD